MSREYITTIGLEVHVQLKTQSKMFCACRVEYGSEPNTNTCPTCLGLPGALPVMNGEALRLTVLAGLMLGCEIPEVCKFDRKNYYYPDMPKNYQISQYDQPLCLGGSVPLHETAYPKDVQKTIAAPGKTIRLTRIHLEEDVAKSFHLESSSGIDFNRAGTPLMEIVSEADIASPEEAFAYLTVLRQMLVYGKISDADMEKGQMRCDVNVSVRPLGQQEYGTKIELKNLNSISGVRRALAFEIERQIAIVKAGGTLDQETRRWDDDRGETTLMRIKESAHDYRYFPDPDLLPVRTAQLIEAARISLPELPQAKRERFVANYGISEYDAAVLADDQAMADCFEIEAKGSRNPKSVANLMINDVQSALSAQKIDFKNYPFPAGNLSELTNLISAGNISLPQGKVVLLEMMMTPSKSPSLIIEEKGLAQVSEPGTLEVFCDTVIAAHPASVADYKSGKEAALNFLKGQVMKLSKGKANPAIVGEILTKKLA
jgi:aspartyl-tRNA(Asn)/glutamyl-tRNA(Gln) amidotransferase subunit B